MVRRWRFFGSFLRPAFPASRMQHISELHSKFALSMADIQSPTAENRLGKKKKEEERNHKAKI